MRCSRICVYPQDVEIITGKGSRYSRQVIHDIKRRHGKLGHQLVTIEELCDYLGLPYDPVFYIINPQHAVSQQLL